MEAQNPPGEDDTERTWRGPRIAKIAREVGTATVDRVLNVRSSTRNRVLSALERIRQPIRAKSPPHPLPLDKWFGPFHDGTKEAQQRMDERFLARAAQKAAAEGEG
jgi:hypothetical protein